MTRKRYRIFFLRTSRRVTWAHYIVPLIGDKNRLCFHSHWPTFIH